MSEGGRVTARSGHGDSLVAAVHTKMEMTGGAKSRVRGLDARLWVQETVSGCQPMPVTGWPTPGELAPTEAGRVGTGGPPKDTDHKREAQPARTAQSAEDPRAGKSQELGPLGSGARSPCNRKVVKGSRGVFREGKHSLRGSRALVLGAEDNKAFP